MRKLSVIISIIFIPYLLNAQSSNKSENARVLIFKDQEGINVYCASDNNKIVNYLLNDTIKEDYYVIEVLGSKSNRYQINATSLLHSGIKGWIELGNLGINTRSRDSKLLLYEQPDYQSKSLTITLDYDRMVRVTAISSNWLKILLIYDNKSLNYWLPPEYQCPNPYTTCN
jgi:hypothetical protein